MTDLPANAWFEELPGRLDWFRMFVEFLVLTWAIVVVGILVSGRDRPTGARGLDWRVAWWMSHHRSVLITRLADLAGFVGSGVVLIPIAALAGVMIWKRTRRSGLAVLPVLALIDTAVVVQIAKRVVARPRPLPNLASATFGGFSWPSGHAASAAAAAASVWVVAVALDCPASVRRRVSGIAALLAALVAMSRVVLGAHWTTDVLMGGVVGVTVVMLLARPLLSEPPAAD